MAPRPSRPFAQRAREACCLPWEALRDSARLFGRNPSLVKVTLAAGLALAARDIAPAFDMGPDPYDAWRKDGGGAYHVAIFSFLESIWALLTAPFITYAADKFDRRAVYVVLALISFVPTWVYWFVDLDSMQAMWANSIVAVFCATGTTADIGFALAMDVTPFQDRGLASGAFYALKHFVGMLLAPLPCLIFLVFNCFGLRNPMMNHPHLILAYQLVLCALFVIVVLRVKPEKRGSEDEREEDQSNAVSEDSEGSNNDIAAIAFRARDFLCAGVDMLRIMWTDYRLFRLCLAGCILSFCRACALGNNGQYFYQVLNLSQSDRKYIDVNVLRNLAEHLAVPPGFLLTGYFAMKTGALKTLRRLIPITALLLVLGILMEAVRTIWFTIVIEFVLSMTDLYEGPMNRIVAGVAKPGRVGAWLNMFGVAVEVGAMLGSLVIIFVNFIYWRLAGVQMPVWPYYPVCGIALLLSLWPLWTNHPGPAGSHVGWGAAAGLPAEVIRSTFGAVKAAAHWRRKALERRQDPPEPEAHPGSPVSGGFIERVRSRLWSVWGSLWGAAPARPAAAPAKAGGKDNRLAPRAEPAAAPADEGSEDDHHGFLVGSAAAPADDGSEDDRRRNSPEIASSSSDNTHSDNTHSSDSSSSAEDSSDELCWV